MNSEIDERQKVASKEEQILSERTFVVLLVLKLQAKGGIK